MRFLDNEKKGLTTENTEVTGIFNDFSSVIFVISVVEQEFNFYAFVN